MHTLIIKDFMYLLFDMWQNISVWSVLESTTEGCSLKLMKLSVITALTALLFRFPKVAVIYTVWNEMQCSENVQNESCKEENAVL